MNLLSPKLRAILMESPETGPGYQLVEVLRRGGAQRALVFNAELLVSLAELAQIPRMSYGDFLREFRPLTEDNLDFSVIPLRWREPEDLPYVAEPGSQISMPPQRRHTAPYEGFQRFSAYSKDWRIRSDGGLVAGSFATSVNDARVVISGFAAVGRYSLPNPWPAVFVYTVVPKAVVGIDCGTVRPAFGQAGGGVEVFFRDPTAAGTVCGPYAIAEV